MGSWRFPGCYRKQVLFLYHGVLEIPWVLQKVGSVSIPWGLGDSLGVIESRFCFYTMGSWRFPGCYRKQVLFLYHGVLEIPWVLQKVGSVSIPWGLGDSLGVIESRFCFYTMGSWRFPGCYRKQVLFLYHGVLEIPFGVIESRFCFYTMGSWRFPGCYRKQVLFLYHGVLEIPWVLQKVGSVSIPWGLGDSLGVIESRFCFYTMGSWRFPGCYRKQVLFLYHGVLEIPWVLQKVGSVSIPWGLGDSLGVIESRFCFYTMGSWRFPGCYRKQVLFLYHGVLEIPWVLQKVGSVSIPWGLGDSLSVIESRFCFYTMGSWRFPGCYRKQVLFLYHGVLEIPWVLQKVGSVSIPWGLGDSLGVIDSRFCFYTMGSWRFPGCYRKQVLFLYHGVLEIPWVLQKVGSVSIPWGLGDSLSVIESRFCFYTMGSWRFPGCYRKQVLFLYHGVLEIPWVLQKVGSVSIPWGLGDSLGVIESRFCFYTMGSWRFPECYRKQVLFLYHGVLEIPWVLQKVGSVSIPWGLGDSLGVIESRFCFYTMGSWRFPECYRKQVLFLYHGVLEIPWVLQKVGSVSIPWGLGDSLGVIESRFCFYTMGSWRFPGCYRKQVLFLYHGVLEIPWVLQKVGSVSIPWGLGDSLGVIESRFCFYTMGSWRFPGCYRKQVLFLYHGVLEIP